MTQGTSDRTPHDPSGHDLSRRGVLRGAAVGGLALPLLAACGSDGADVAGSESTGGSASGGARVSTSDVPVGGGTILKDAKVVVTQPAEGVFKAFTAVCTHQGCIVGSVADGTINCPCHGSMFSIKNGSVVDGPAPSPLAEKTVSVEGDQVTVA